MLPWGTTQVPPTNLTAGSASHAAAVSALIPPVGQKRTVWNGAARAFSAAMPPEVSAGKNLKRSSPMSIPRMMRSEEHTSELQSLMRISYAVFCLKQKKSYNTETITTTSANQKKKLVKD